jgi:HK97 family phage major capsid protein/HK97 family phage prohead protease
MSVRIKHKTADSAIVAGYGVVFGGRDLEGDTFTRETEYGLERSAEGMPLHYDHATREVKGRVGQVLTVEPDEHGLWVEAEIDRSQKYADEVLQLVERGVLGYSSGALGHLVEREAGVLKTWIVGEWSLTPTPAEPRTVGVQRVKVGEIIDVRDEPTGGEPVSDETIPSIGDQVKTLSDQVGQLLQYAEDAPAIRNAGYISRDGGVADKKVKTFGDFLTAVRRGDTKRLREVYGSTKAMEEGTGASGGYLVPRQFVNRLMEVAVERSIVRPRAFVLPMSGKDAIIPAIDYSSSYTAGSSAFLGGMQMKWTAEGATVPGTEPKMKKLELTAHKMSGKVPVSNELLADNAAGLEALLVRLFGWSVAFTEDYAFLSGDGVGKPLGVANAGATITTATALTAAAPKVSELATMYKRLMPYSRGTAVWVINTLLSDALLSINADSATGNPSSLSYLPDLNGRIIPRLFGLPVLETEKIETTFSAGGLMLVDFQQYVVGSRQQVEIAFSEHVNFDDDETVWRCTARVEGQPWINAPIKIGPGATDTVSPFVKSK